MGQLQKEYILRDLYLGGGLDFLKFTPTWKHDQLA